MGIVRTVTRMRIRMRMRRKIILRSSLSVRVIRVIRVLLSRHPAIQTNSRSRSLSQLDSIWESCHVYFQPRMDVSSQVLLISMSVFSVAVLLTLVTGKLEPRQTSHATSPVRVASNFKGFSFKDLS